MNVTYNKTHSTLVGYILWFFGFTGAHRFYYGKNISGVIWLCTLGLFGIGWIIDLFLIPSMSREANKKYTLGSYDYSVAWVLHTYTGIFGLHRFYLGKWPTGLLYLFTGGLVGIGYIYDFFTLNRRVDDINSTGLPVWWK